MRAQRIALIAAALLVLGGASAGSAAAPAASPVSAPATSPASAPATSPAAARTAGPGAPMYANLKGETLLDNERVFVQKFIVQPGESTGIHRYANDELLVFIKGGVLRTNATGRAVLWKDGRVVFHSASSRSDEGSTNAGSTPVEMIAVTLKPVAEGLATPGPYLIEVVL